MEIVKVIGEIVAGGSKTLHRVSREDLDSIRTTVSRMNGSLRQSKKDGRITTVIVNASPDDEFTYEVTISRYPGRLRKVRGRFVLPSHPLSDRG